MADEMPSHVRSATSTTAPTDATERPPDGRDHPRRSPSASRAPDGRGPRGRGGRTTPARSRSSRGSRRSASAPACTSARPASAACTTWSRRSSTTPSTRRWPATATRIDVTLLADGGVRVVDNGRGIPVDIAPGRGQAGGRGRPHRAARRRQVRRRRLQGLRRPARRRRLGRQRAVDPARRRGPAATATCWTAVLRPRRARRRRSSKGEATDETGTTITSGPTPTSSRPPTTTSRRLRAASSEMAFLNKGLTITLTRRAAEAAEIARRSPTTPSTRRSTAGPTASTAPTTARIERRFRYDDGLVDFVKHLNAASKAEPVHREVIAFEAEDTERQHVASRSRCSGTPRYTESVHTFANTINTHEGGTHEEGFRAALTTLVNNFARRSRTCSRRRTTTSPATTSARASPRSSRSSSASRSSRARPRPSSATPRPSRSCRGSSTTSSATGSRRNPAEGKDIVRKAIRPRPRPDRGPQGARARPRRKGLLGGGGLPGKLRRLPVDQPRGVRGLHRRGRLGRRLGQAAAATRRPRRSCRSAARSSTSRRPASTRCWPTTRSRR